MAIGIKSDNIHDMITDEQDWQGQDEETSESAAPRTLATQAPSRVSGTTLWPLNLKGQTERGMVNGARERMRETPSLSTALREAGLGIRRRRKRRGSGAARMSYVECCTCGFEPEEQSMLPRTACPKCHAETWRRSFTPGALLLGLARSQPSASVAHG
jgi:hypothetical protein